MEIKELLKEIKSVENCFEIQRHFSKEYEGGCPCFDCELIVNGVTVSVNGHCWRVCKECAYNGLHITGALPEKDLLKIGKAFKRQLDKQKWYSKYELIIKST